VLHTPAARGILLAELESADRVVLLGDVLSLRAAAAADVVADALPFFDGLGEVVGERELVLVPGNHDYHLAAPMVAARAPSLELETRSDPRHETGAPWRALWRSLSRAEVTIAYPGLWLRPGTYATHGHYLDCHAATPRIETLAARGMMGLVGAPPDFDARVADYEAVLAPIYEFAQARAQAPARTTTAPPILARLLDAAQGQAWARLEAERLIPRPGAALAGAAMGLAAVTVVGRPPGPLLRGLTPQGIGAAGLRGMCEVVLRLGIAAQHVIFGHTHRAGPFGGEAAAWRAPSGPRLHNPGSWVYAPTLIGPGATADPYWPGRVLRLEDEGAPVGRALLAGRRDDQGQP